jgi:hypothetical protein
VYLGGKCFGLQCYWGGHCSHFFFYFKLQVFGYFSISLPWVVYQLE